MSEEIFDDWNEVKKETNKEEFFVGFKQEIYLILKWAII